MRWSWVLLMVGCGVVELDLGDVAEMIPTYDGYEAQLQALHGRSINDVVDDWGAPMEQMKLAGGHVVYVWKSENTVTTPDRVHLRESPDGKAVDGEIHHGEKLGVSCTTTLRSDGDGIVVSHKAEGAGCVGFAPESAGEAPHVAAVEAGSPDDEAEPEEDERKTKRGRSKKR